MPPTVADIRMSADAFPFGRVFTEVPDVEIEVERIVPTSDALLPLLWIETGAAASVMSTLASDPTVEKFERLVETDDRSLYAVTWSTEVGTAVSAMLDAGAELLSATGTAESWEFRLLFRVHEDLTKLRQTCEDEGVDFEILRVFHPGDRAEDALTPAQRETLAVAYERGYWEVPRGITQQELAAELGVSANATSQRLRRGTRVAVGGLLRDLDPGE